MNPRPILAAVALAAVLALPAVRALADLDRARGWRDTMRAAATAPPPPPVAVPAAAFPANDAADARRRLAARVQAAARSGGVLVEAIGSDGPRPPALATLTLRASGPEKAMLAFVDTLERGERPVRLHRWQLTPVPGGIRLIGRVVAPWRG
ncbi:hypothetical protein [Sphingomonas sp. Leaf4]|uniref:hypothetical protein n=1 Tax=Sphingomonas sp. Leaf4 TaxID=2876553 RepID=UPI001E50067A|nr:hypothetical protein [Sphingomonas sp. Leaf4]